MSEEAQQLLSALLALLGVAVSTVGLLCICIAAAAMDRTGS